ncbi:MAG: hypothetical protein RL217_864 [Pseudomonadota bacterium]
MTLTHLQRSALCAALAQINSPHVQFWQEHQNIDCAPYFKFLSKHLSFLRGELKSEANLLRFHEDFMNWRENLAEADNLAFRILELCNACLHSALESLFDPDCDDMALILGSLTALWDEMDELGHNSQELRLYWQELEAEILAQVGQKAQRPLAKDYFLLLKDADVSLFGLGN